ncbi:MAG: M20/M25/M40 family metallo-hydrolase [Oscillospiraceae bacterium]
MANKDRIVEEFKKLVSIDSPSLGERQMGDYLKRELIELGFSVSEDNAGSAIGGNCGNIYGFLAGDSTQSPILFCSHMDTVAPAIGKRAVLMEGGIIRSGGDTVLGADDAAGIAAILEALRTVIESGLEHRAIEVLFTVCEEVYCSGSKQLDFSRLRAKEAYVLDVSGSAGTAANQAPTILSFTVSIQGKAAHAGFAPEKGVHAIKAAADAIVKLPNGRVDSDTTLNFGVISGGLATNIIPDLCTVVGEVRSFSHEKALEVAQQVKAQFERSAGDLGAKIDFETTIACKAYQTPEDHPVVQRFETACRKLNIAPSLIQTFGGSDNNTFAQHGITGLALASAMFHNHSCDEYTTVDDLVRVSELAAAIMML